MKNTHTQIFKGIFVLLAFFSFSFLFANSVHAESISIGTAPTSEKLKLVPGQKYNGELVVWNLTPKASNYNIIVRGFRQIENQPGTAILLTENEEAKSLYTATTWMKVSIDSIELIPNKNEKIYYEINVPKDATKGEYTVIIAFESENEAVLTGTGATTTLTLGMPILVQIGDEFVENAELLKFSTEKSFYEYPTITFDTRIKNLGDTHITPVGEIVLTNIFNQEITRLPFNPNSQSILRDNSGNYETLWNLGSFLTKDKAIVLGPIKANLIVTYRTFQPGFAPLTSELTFWIIPWKIILIALVVIIAIIVIVRVSKKKKRIAPTTPSPYPSYPLPK
ncbi:MAG: hypothetical protein US24_C0047G0003 [candidate division WS6 bacterium GW2011_GWC2_36_7]|uniref:DUF916 domain-containing protein n=1 Tax=candidate division WS6 bacterium GW2011_GWC2_36_7 TaxID=1619091 RepID=A0A0G0HFW7_9BACT|nr:MAG: hypothetical protein US24_C0047G0003 [candidate division WS6 bacterium GW2011_GWC2_36_7]